MTSEPNPAPNDHSGAGDHENALAVGSRVVIEQNRSGKIVDDFGPPVEGSAVDLGGGHETKPRRWAVALDDGDLVFVDDDGLEPEGRGPATLKE
ncbi:MAG: hypothetical protein C0482_15570 [Gordonia sp.]|jgi:hypothetical protein|uniref:hypothetical protein n=1 Tax=Williamsia sp. 1138 TaxID=1903117 RepID=UPI000A0FA39E|nr:hypothetical protein [Williamsia sp. 1138]MBA4023775.1 hypothetical protein [Gordonia sp. (in: high G+C Gram-positive bacteria)]OZG25967.1 hypothetical protein BH683_027985 [Williamsia sp. 1138]